MPGGRAAVASAGKRSAPSSCSRSRGTEAFSSEVETGSRQENASNQKSRAPFRFHRNGALERFPAKWKPVRGSRVHQRQEATPSEGRDGGEVRPAASRQPVTAASRSAGLKGFCRLETA